jgi:hypothetical protein
MLLLLLCCVPIPRAVSLAMDTPATAQDELHPAASVRLALEPKPEITRAEIEAHVRYLASDEMKGRVTGTPEADRAAEYLGLVLQREGLEPAGDDHTFLQAVPMVRSRSTAVPELAFTDAQGTSTKLVFGADFDVSARPLTATDLRVVVVHSQADLPKSADAKVALFVDATATQRKKWFEAAGLEDGSGFGLLVSPGNSKRGAERGPDSLGSSLVRKKSTALPPMTLRVHGPALESLRKGEVRTLSLATHAVREDVRGSNVAALLRGHGTREHPEFAEQAVVFTAHYDHLDHEHTHSRSEGKDQIWNGADDDASGTAAVLEIAGAFAKAEPPARTLVFVLVTGEEIGLLGTDEYLDRPVVPLAKTVANLNFEMIGRADPKVGGPGNLWLTGFDLTNLGSECASHGLAIRADPYPAEHFFERSDNIAFVHRGVVGQTFSTYNLHKDYHQPSDEADTLDYVHMEACTKAGYGAARLVADGVITPAWLAGKDPNAKSEKPDRPEKKAK